MHLLAVLPIVATLVAMPVTTLAQGEPNSSTTSVAPCTPAVVAVAAGLSVDFAATCMIVGPCVWDFGDQQTAEGDTVSHTFAADGEYTIKATCGEAVVVHTLRVGAGSSYTGFGLIPFGVAIAALVVLGAGALFLWRRARAGR